MGLKSQLSYIFLITLITTSCSNSGVVESDISLESDNNNEVAFSDEEDVFMLDIGDDDSFEVVDEKTLLATRELRSDSIFDSVEKEEVVSSSNNKSRAIASVDQKLNAPKTDEYIVQRNDTAIKIAFDLYKDINKWKEIVELNGTDVFEIGQSIVVPKVPNEIVYNTPEGSPYLIRKYDSLSRISKKVYNGEYKYWVNIWNNNKNLVTDKDLIFPGFTIFYKDISVVKSEYTKIKKHRKYVEKLRRKKRSEVSYNF